MRAAIDEQVVKAREQTGVFPLTTRYSLSSGRSPCNGDANSLLSRTKLRGWLKVAVVGAALVALGHAGLCTCPGDMNVLGIGEDHDLVVIGIDDLDAGRFVLLVLCFELLDGERLCGSQVAIERRPRELLLTV